MRKLFWFFSVLVLPIMISMTKVNVEIISVLPYDFGVVSAVIWTGAALELAVQAANKKYAPFLNVSLRIVYNVSHRNCDDIASDAISGLSEIHYKQTNPASVYALIASACSDSIGIASVAAGWDWLLFTNGLAPDVFLNDASNINPTTLAVGGTFQFYATFAMKILTFYRWSHVTVFLQAKALSPFYNLVANSLIKQGKQNKNFAFYMDLYTFKHENGSMSDAVRYAKQRSRVIVILAHGNAVLHFLLMADAAGLANGEYVFINIQPQQQEFFGRTSDFSHPAVTNLKAFQSFLFLTYSPTVQDLHELNRSIIERAQFSYGKNFVYEAGSQSLNAFPVHASLDLVDILTATVNETATTKQTGSRWSGRQLARQMSNRTFVGLTTGDLYITRYGERFLDMDVFQFDLSTKTMQSIAWWNGQIRQLIWLNKTVDWPTIDGKAPLDVPICGFSGDIGACAERSISLLNILLPVIVSIGMVFGSVLLFLRFGYKSVDQGWLISPEDLRNQINSDSIRATEITKLANRLI